MLDLEKVGYFMVTTAEDGETIGISMHGHNDMVMDKISLNGEKDRLENSTTVKVTLDSHPKNFFGYVQMFSNRDKQIWKVWVNNILFTDGYYGSAFSEELVKYFRNEEDAKEYHDSLVSKYKEGILHKMGKIELSLPNYLNQGHPVFIDTIEVE